MKNTVKTALFFSLLSTSVCYADVTLPKLLSNNLVLQRNTDNILWGWADKDETVSVFLDGELQGRTSPSHGQWQISLAAMPAGGPHSIEVRGDNRIILSNVMFGDVWVASGQSNMQTTMQRTAEMFANAIAEANHPNLRQYTVPRELNLSLIHISEPTRPY